MREIGESEVTNINPRFAHLVPGWLMVAPKDTDSNAEG